MQLRGGPFSQIFAFQFSKIRSEFARRWGNFRPFLRLASFGDSAKIPGSLLGQTMRLGVQANLATSLVIENTASCRGEMHK